MPNIGSVLKQEIARVARRETRSQIQMLRRASAQQRRGIASLKRSIAALERQIAALKGAMARSAAVQGDGEATQPTVRFSPKGIRSLRRRLGLSAGDLARLIDVSAQSVYNWERKVTRPRAAQLAALAELRSVGKREIAARLEALDAGGAEKKRTSSAAEK